MGTEKNNWLLYSDQLPSAGELDSRPQEDQRWQPSPGDRRPHAHGGAGSMWAANFISFIKQMALWSTLAFGSETRTSWVTRGHVSLYLYLQRGENYEEIRNQKTTRWNVPWGQRPLSDLVCTQRTFTELKRKDDKTLSHQGKTGRAFGLKTKESINNAEAKTPIIPNTRGTSVILGLRDRSCGSESQLRPFIGRMAGGS